ncbi:MAG: hypothetical protein H8E46_08280 [FCB group bacterium]|nr:hypothetical protein [FCB group bacterium]
MNMKLFYTAILTLGLIFAGSTLAGDIETLKKEIPLGEEKSVEIFMEMGLADLKITAGESQSILLAHVNYNPDKIKPIIDYSPGKIGRLEIECRKKSRVKFDDLDHDENEWRLAFTDRIPLEIDLELGMGEGELDLTGLLITGMTIDAGLSELIIEFDEPNKEVIERLRVDSGLGEFVAKGLLNANIDEFRFSGGLGSSELYFTGESHRPTEAKIEVGLGSLEITLKKDLPVKIYYEKSFLSSIDFDYFKRIDDDVYVSKNWDENAPDRLILEIEIGLGSVCVTWE